MLYTSLPPHRLTGPSAPRDVTVRLVMPRLAEIRWRRPVTVSCTYCIIHHYVIILSFLSSCDRPRGFYQICLILLSLSSRL